MSNPGSMLVAQPVSIRAQTSLADPDTCKFTVSRSLHAGGPFFFSNQERSVGSPLVERLFALSGVVNVLIAENVATIGKAADATWAELKIAIAMAIRTQLLSGVPSILEMAACAISSTSTSTLGRSDAELGVLVQQLLDKEVNRSVANHGGKISLVDVCQGKLFIRMSGGCQGCGSAQVTLRQGLEVMVKRIAPEIMEIVDVTDHAAGKQPFYPRAG